MKNLINKTKELINWQVKAGTFSFPKKKFSGVNPLYEWTNENIPGYLDLVDTSKMHRALAVTAGGDHLFHLLTRGITDIDTFDVNVLTEYFALGLKKALILKYSYEEFHIIMNKISEEDISVTELTTILLELIPFMEGKYQYFWSEIINFNYQLQKNKSHPLNLLLLLNYGNYLFFYNLEAISYLGNKENYDTLKKQLIKATIKFQRISAEELPNFFKGGYDCILLSNILDYFTNIWGDNWSYEQLENYANALAEMLNPDGVIFLKYCFKSIENNSGLFIGSNVTEKDLKNESIYSIPSMFGGEDKIILRRKK